MVFVNISKNTSEKERDLNTPHAKRNETSTSLVLGNGLRLLSIIARTNGELSLREIGRMLDLSPTVTHRLVSTLRQHGYLEKNPVSGKYMTGIECFLIGQTFTKATSIEAIAKPLLQEAALEHKVNCFLGVRKKTSIVYLYDFSAAERNSIRIARGTELPLNSTAMGIATLAQMSEQELADYRSQISKDGKQGVGSQQTYKSEEIAFAKQHGFAKIHSEVFPGVTAIGAVVEPNGHYADIAISFGAPTEDFSKERILLLGRRIVELAKQISDQIYLRALSEQPGLSRAGR